MSFSGWESEHTWMLNSYWTKHYFFQGEWHVFLMVNFKEKNTLIRMKQAWCIDLSICLVLIYIWRGAKLSLNSTVDYMNSNFYIYPLCLHFHYTSTALSDAFIQFQSYSHFNLLLHSAYLSEFVSIKEFWRLYYSTWINGKWNALETRSASFNSLQKVTDTKMHLMQSDLFIQSWIYEQFTRSQMTTLF